MQQPQQAPWIDQLGDWNPQLLRELRGRLKPRSMIAAIALSAICQLLALFWVDSTRQAWLVLWRSMTYIFPYVLFTIGGYLIVSDLTQEEKRGTFNFIRLSPRPAWQILLGKALGVPILLYLIVVLAIPLHLVAAITAGVPPLIMLSFYLLLLAGCSLCYSAAMLFGLSGGAQSGWASRQSTAAISFAAIALLIFSPLFNFWLSAVTWRSLSKYEQILGRIYFYFGDVSWFYLNLSQNFWLAHAFTLINTAIGTALIWRVLLRSFRQPRSTILSKRQSYVIAAYAEVFVLGFWLSQDQNSSLEVQAIAAMMYIFTFVMLLVLMFGICPQRQALLDWAKYQSQGWQSWVWGAKSPILLAILIHLVIVSALLLPWLFLIGIGTEYPLQTAIAVVAIGNVLLICGVFIQQVFAAKIRYPTQWALGGLALGLLLPPVLLALLRLVPDLVPASIAIWTFLGYPFWLFSNKSNLLLAIVGILAQWLVLAFLLWKFQRTLQRLTAS